MSVNLQEFVIDIANSIRNKKGTADIINPQDFCDEIDTIFTHVAPDFIQNFLNKSLTVITEADLQGVTEIGDGAFSGCTKLVKVELPNSVVALSSTAFDGCTSIKDIKVPIQFWSYINRPAVERIEIQTGVTEINNIYISNVANLKELVLPKGLITISILEEYFISGCPNLRKLVIPASMDSNYGKFGNLKDMALTEIEGPFGLIINNSNISNNLKTTLEKYIINSIPNEDAWVSGDYNLTGYKALKTVAINDSYSIIPPSMFAGCSALEEFTIPEGVAEICDNAFNECSYLTELTIPSSVTTIGSKSLYIGSASNNATLTFLSKNPSGLSINADFIGYSNNTKYVTKIIVPKGYSAAYKAIAGLSNYASVIEEATE